ncbi:MAG: ThiF family adenylyltransferase [Betaproteobacteria bacterium]|nr:ThiF family adenylyltransferase [Betaproteobacteria bacterium]
MINDELARRLGDRHLHPEFEAKLGPISGASHRVVQLTASPEVAETIPGQHLIWMLANLLARQFLIVHELVLHLPPVSTRPEAVLFSPGAANAILSDAILATIRLIAGDAVDVKVVNDIGRRVDVEIIIGRCIPNLSAQYSIGVYADGWNLFVGDPDLIPLREPHSALPLGPYFAACVAAGETFKVLRKLKPNGGTFARKLFVSLQDFKSADSWDKLPLIGETVRFVPPFYLVGAGAVGQALACALGASALKQAYMTVVDHDSIDKEGTNLNRCALATQEDIGTNKSDLTARFLVNRGIEVFAYPHRWERYMDTSSRPAQRIDVVAAERMLKFPLVISCVDDNAVRHELQRLWPDYLIGGSTNGMSLEVTAYDMRSKYECLMCFNPLPRIGTTEEIAGQFRELSREDQEAKAKLYGLDLEAILRYLASPKCGSPGENELKKFAEGSQGVRPSVGFVSVGAGVILAAQIMKYSLDGRSAFPHTLGNSVRFSFLQPSHFRWTIHQRNRDCDCFTKGQAAFQRVWGS